MFPDVAKCPWGAEVPRGEALVYIYIHLLFDSVVASASYWLVLEAHLS